ncbi:M3 family metallopeptidase [Vibrio lentus]|nr:M3 family metallopeptidase [Vibrio lentus]
MGRRSAVVHFGHFETGEALPKEMLEKMLAAKNFQSAMFILRQLELLVRFHTAHRIRSRSRCSRTER